MGLTITASKSDIELSGGYGMLIKIRTRVATAFDKEFGEHYETMFSYPSKGSVWFKEFNEKTKEILSDERFKDEDKDIVDFLFMSDCEGEIKSKTCGKIYNLIKDIDEPDLTLRYDYYSDNDWEDFKSLLKECYSKRMKLVWY